MPLQLVTIAPLFMTNRVPFHSERNPVFPPEHYGDNNRSWNRDHDRSQWWSATMGIFDLQLLQKRLLWLFGEMVLWDMPVWKSDGDGFQRQLRSLLPLLWPLFCRILLHVLQASTSEAEVPTLRIRMQRLPTVRILSLVSYTADGTRDRISWR